MRSLIIHPSGVRSLPVFRFISSASLSKFEVQSWQDGE